MGLYDRFEALVMPSDKIVYRPGWMLRSHKDTKSSHESCNCYQTFLREAII